MASKTIEDSPGKSAGKLTEQIGAVVRRTLAGVPIGRILLYFITSRLLILMVALLSVSVLKKGDFYPAGKRKTIDLLNCWDAGWYQGIAADGYHYDSSQVSNTAFFPLFPMLMRMASFVTHDLRIAGFLVSNGFLFLSCLLLWKLARQNDFRQAVADRSVLFFLFAPMTFFYSTIYSESVCIFWIMATLYLAGERRWLAAGVCGFFAGLSRNVGVLLVVPLAIEGCRAFRPVNFAGVVESRNRYPVLVCLAMPGLGLATYIGFLWAKFGEPFAFVKTQQHWGRHLSFVWETLKNAPCDPFYRVWFFSFIVLALVLIVLGWGLRIRLSYLLFEVVYLVVVLSGGILESVPRFLSIMFPFYLTLAMLVTRWPRLEAPLLTLSTALLTLSTILFVNGYWFT